MVGMRFVITVLAGFVAARVPPGRLFSDLAPGSRVGRAESLVLNLYVCILSFLLERTARECSDRWEPKFISEAPKRTFLVVLGGCRPVLTREPLSFIKLLGPPFTSN
jgi:hypothetical protein